ncbi:MAG: RidA family protein [Rhizobiales bacterium]|nr:RidA family protein [Hyphomicrobiales bacterium]MBI3672488.1 RidA family protein [Hyphomicrobiales bacterium]
MLTPITTGAAPKPFSAYSQAIAVDPGARYLFVAGQVGATVDGDIPGDAARQHELAWQNVLAILAASAMDHRNIVDVHVYITDRGHLSLYREIRDRMLKGHRPAATLLVVSGLADPRFVVEVAVVAAAPAT